MGRRGQLAVAVVVAPTLVVATAAAIAIRDRHRPPPAPALTESSGGIVTTFEHYSASVALGSKTAARLRVTLADDFAGLRLRIVGTGPVRVERPRATSVLLPQTSGASTTLTFRVTAPGRGALRALLTGVRRADQTPVTHVTSLYFSATSQRVGLSTWGPMYARAASIRANSARRRQLQRLGSGGAVDAVGPATPDGVGAGGSAVTGVIRYQDSAGAPHPARNIDVELRDCSGSESGHSLGAIRTDARGQYAVQANVLPTNRVFLRVFASGLGFSVMGLVGGRAHLDSGCHAIAGPIRLDLTANNVDDNNTALSVADAVGIGRAYFERMAGKAPPDVTVQFPTSRPTSSWNVKGDHLLHVLRTDRFDWDVILHEYGHFVSDVLDIATALEGRHGLDENLAKRLGKQNGIGLAWREGWPTFFSLSAQKALGVAAWHVPRAGDENYDDTEDVDPPLSYSIVSQAGGASTGEDNEISVQRSLWAVAFGQAGRMPALGDATIWKLVSTGHVRSLPELYSAIVAGRSPAEIGSLGCAFGDQAVAPRLLDPPDHAVAKADEPATFTWAPGGTKTGGRTKFPPLLTDEFVVEYYSQGFDRLLLASEPRRDLSFTPPAAEWIDMVRTSGGALHVMVRGTQTAAPRSGPYASCPVEVRLPDLPPST